MRNIKIILVFFTILCIGLSSAQLKAQTDGLHILAQGNYIFSDGDNAPYWLTACRQGLSSIETRNGYFRIGGTYNGKFGKSNSFNYKFATDIVVNENNKSDFFLQQIYGEISWRWLTLCIGSKERFSEQKGDKEQFSSYAFGQNRVNTLFPNIYAKQLSDLSSGGLAYSGNSRPIPQVRIEIPEYTPFPGTNGWLQVRAHIAYGRFSDDKFQEDFTRDYPTARYGKNILFHSKAAFIKIGKEERFPLIFEGGLEMYSQFGGDIYSHRSGHILSMPNGPKEYFKAFIPLSGGDDTPVDEQTNISGNQIGNWHIAFTIPTNKCDIRFYGEHMFEDFSQLFFVEYQSNKDGKRRIIYYPWRDIMLGVRITNKSNIIPFVDAVQYEYLSTYDQSGALYHDPSKNFNDQMDGVDNYYNHGIYPGWHHWGMGIGNPLAISPVYNRNGDLEFRGNRLTAHNVGINGHLSCIPLAYRLQYTYSENWGSYYHPFDSKRYTTSLLGEFIYAPRESNWLASLSVGYDKSNLIGNNIGAMFTLAHVFSITKNKK